MAFYKCARANFCRSFLCQVPIAAGCCLLLARGLQTSLPKLEGEEEPEGRPEESENELQPVVLSFDFPGAINLAIGISSLLTVIDLRNQLPWEHPLVLSISIVGFLAIVCFIILEAYPGNREPLMPLPLLKTEVGAFCAGQVSRFLHNLTSPRNMFCSHNARKCLVYNPYIFQ